MMAPERIFSRDKRMATCRYERPVWPRVAVFIGVSLLVHILLAQLGGYRQPPLPHRTERVVVSLFKPPLTFIEPPPVEPAPRPVVQRPRPVVPPTHPPVIPPAGTPEGVSVNGEPPAAAASADAATAVTGDGGEGAPQGETDQHASEMADLVRRIQKKATPKSDQPAMTGATERNEANPQPQYPALARANHWQGIVHMEVSVSAEGRVERIAVTRSSGHDILDDAAINAVRYWRFVPARKGDVAVPDTVTVSIQFPTPKKK